YLDPAPPFQSKWRAIVSESTHSLNGGLCYAVARDDWHTALDAAFRWRRIVRMRHRFAGRRPSRRSCVNGPRGCTSLRTYRLLEETHGATGLAPHHARNTADLSRNRLLV